MSSPLAPSVDPDCLFCKIVAGEIPATMVARNATVVAFRDVNPQAPTHVLVIPVEHHPNAAAVAAADPSLVGELVAQAAAIAAAEGVPDDYRLVFNTGVQAGQSVFHAHLHLLGGRGFGWPPG
jgi:histidine triad (HIT) family protein